MHNFLINKFCFLGGSPLIYHFRKVNFLRVRTVLWSLLGPYQTFWFHFTTPSSPRSVLSEKWHCSMSLHYPSIDIWPASCLSINNPILMSTSDEMMITTKVKYVWPPKDIWFNSKNNVECLSYTKGWWIWAFGQKPSRHPSVHHAQLLTMFTDMSSWSYSSTIHFSSVWGWRWGNQTNRLVVPWRAKID